MNAERFDENPFDSNDDEVRDSFRACLLRFRFQDQPFLGLWRALKDAGWAHDSSTRTYRSPSGRVFDGARPVARYLDRHAIGDAQSNLEVSDGGEPHNDDNSDDDGGDDGIAGDDLRLPSSSRAKIVWTAEEQELAWKLRVEAVAELWRRASNAGKSSGDPTNNNKKLDESDHDRMSDDDEESSPRSRARRSPRLSTERHDSTSAVSTAAAAQKAVPWGQSEAMTEKGTALYLAKNSRRVRFQNKRSNTVHADAADVAMDKLVAPSVDACQKRLHEVARSRRDAAVDRYRDHFSDWRWLLSTNHSLLFYGAGSKVELLNAFADEVLSREGYVLVLNGFDKDITIEAILDLMVNMFLGGAKGALAMSRSRIPHADGIEGVTATGTYTPWKAEPVVERAIQLGRALAERGSETMVPIFLVVHALEGLNNRIAQEALSSLLVNSVLANGVAAVRLAASVDHVDAPLLWNTTTKANFSFLYQQVHTHLPYAEELCALPTRKKADPNRKRAAKVPRSDQASTEFLKTLSPRIAEVLQILARLQLDALAKPPAGDGGDYMGGKGKRSTNKKGPNGTPPPPPRIAYSALSKECKRACTITKESLLKTFLVELQDHGFVEYEDGMVCIPHGADKLKELLAVSSRPRG
jgi:origin recognition complex subunit 2